MNSLDDSNGCHGILLKPDDLPLLPQQFHWEIKTFIVFSLVTIGEFFFCRGSQKELSLVEGDWHDVKQEI